MLGADVVVAELQCLTQAQLKNALGARGEGNVSFDRLLTFTDNVDDCCANRVLIDVKTFQGLRGHAFTLGNQAEQKVLGTDVVVIEAARFILREDDDPSGSVRKAFKHRFSLCSDRGLKHATCFSLSPTLRGSEAVRAFVHQGQMRSVDASSASAP